MIRVHFQPPATEEWKKWVDECEKTARKLKPVGGKLSFNHSPARAVRKMLPGWK
jgi:hypothetical protein